MSISQKDAQFYHTILTTMKNAPDVDWALVAEKAGYANGKVAQTRYGQIRRKVSSLVGENEQAIKVKKENGAKPKPSRMTPRKGRGENKSALVKAKAGAGPRIKLEDKFEEDEEEEEEKEEEEEEEKEV